LKIITGNPGTGKHTVAKKLAKKIGLELLDINKVAIEACMVKKSGQAINIDVRKLKKTLDKKMSNNMLLVGHLAPYVVSKNKVEVAVVLRRSPYNLENTYRNRRYTKRKSIENLGSEIIGVTYYDTIKNIGRKKTFQFDTTNRSISSVVKKIESLFVKGKIKEDNIDWLEIVSKKRDLERFFPY